MAKPPSSYDYKAIREFEDAVREHSWIGSKHPDDHPEIEENYKRAKARLLQRLQR